MSEMGIRHLHCAVVGLVAACLAFQALGLDMGQSALVFALFQGSLSILMPKR